MNFEFSLCSLYNSLSLLSLLSLPLSSSLSSMSSEALSLAQLRVSTLNDFAPCINWSTAGLACSSVTLQCRLDGKTPSKDTIPKVTHCVTDICPWLTFPGVKPESALSTLSPTGRCKPSRQSTRKDSQIPSFYRDPVRVEGSKNRYDWQQVPLSLPARFASADQLDFDCSAPVMSQRVCLGGVGCKWFSGEQSRGSD